MAELEHVIAGEWFEVRERIHHADKLFDFLIEQDRIGLTPMLWEATADDLERSIEGGIYEFKRRMLVVQLAKLEEAAYTSELFGTLARERIATTALLAVCSIQRALLAGELRFLPPGEAGTYKNGDERASGVETEERDDGEAVVSDTAQERSAPESSVTGPDTAASADIRRIITDVQEIVATDPSMKMNAAIKNIMLQLAKYREEASTYQKLKEQATTYRLEMYSKTFSASFARIFESIRRNYKGFLEEREELRQRTRGTALDEIDTKEWVRLVLQQMEEISRIRATFLFVEREHSGMREPLVALGKRREMITSLLDREQELAEDLAGGEGAGHRLGRILAVEIARRLHEWSRE